MFEQRGHVVGAGEHHTLGHVHTRVLDARRQLVVGQAVEAKLVEHARHVHLGVRLAAGIGHDFQEPTVAGFGVAARSRPCSLGRWPSRGGRAIRRPPRVADLARLVRGSSPSQNSKVRTRFQNGSGAEMVRKCASIFCFTSASDSAGSACKSGTTAHATCSATPSGNPTTESSLMYGEPLYRSSISSG